MEVLERCCFTFCAVMTQIAISNGEPLFQVDYSDNFDVSDDEGYDDEEAEDSSDSEEEEDVNSEASEEVGDSDVGEGGSDSEEDEGFVDRLEEVSDSGEDLDEMEEAMM